MKQLAVIVGLLITIFFATYFLTGFAVDKILGDEAYGQSDPIYKSELKVEPYFGEQKPNFKIQETQDPQWGMR